LKAKGHWCREFRSWIATSR